MDRVRFHSSLVLAAWLLAGALLASEGHDGQSPSERAIRAANEALAANPRDTAALARRAGLYAVAGKPELAIADYDRLLELDPDRAEGYDARGSEHFKLGQVDASIADFDRYLARRPDQQPWHWKRGISYYYAGKYEAGRRQFEGYQTVDDNDVENAVWRYLCMVPLVGLEAARADLLKIKPDPRVGMMAVYDLFRGKSQPDEVLAAARSGSPSAEEINARLFYAHLYLALYYEAQGDAAQARKHMTTAAERHPIDHYMWNVADVHAKRLKDALQP